MSQFEPDWKKYPKLQDCFDEFGKELDTEIGVLLAEARDYALQHVTVDVIRNAISFAADPFNAVLAERKACAEIADAEAKKYAEMARKWEASGDCSARNIHEAGGAAIVGREIRDAIRLRGDT
jgi:hypothetical protein